MPELTQDEARQLAQEFFEVSKNVGDFRFDHFDRLTPQQNVALQNLQHQLSTQSNQLTALAISIGLDDLEPTLDRIQEVTDGVNQAVTTLNDIRKVISIATTFVSLGAAIASGSPSTIASAIQDTVQSLQG
jgi:hypothetical protein